MIVTFKKFGVENETVNINARHIGHVETAGGGTKEDGKTNEPLRTRIFMAYGRLFNIEVQESQDEVLEEVSTALEHSIVVETAELLADAVQVDEATDSSGNDGQTVTVQDNQSI